MKRFTFGHITDMHLCPQGHIPQARVEHFHSQIRAKWDFLMTVFRDRGVSMGILSGDVFHLKASFRYHPKDILRYSSWFQNSGVPWAVIPGNHDLPASSYEFLDESAFQLLNKATPNFRDLTQEGCLSVPLGDEKKVVFYGVAYSPLDIMVKDIEVIGTLMDPEAINVLLVHGDFYSDPSFGKFWTVLSYGELCARAPHADVICLGHIHKGEPVLQCGRALISKPWSFTRVAKDYFVTTDILEESHVPSVNLIHMDIEDSGDCRVSIESVPLDVVPFDSSFYRDEVMKQIKNVTKLNEFLSTDLMQGDGSFEFLDPMEYLDSLEVSKRIRDKVRDYLDEAERPS